jgi:hypothetical protein
MRLTASAFQKRLEQFDAGLPRIADEQPRLPGPQRLTLFPRVIHLVSQADEMKGFVGHHDGPMMARLWPNRSRSGVAVGVMRAMKPLGRALRH